MRIFLIGYMGSGKTHWGRKLAEAIHMPFFDLDQVITNTLQQNIPQIFMDHGEEYFRYKEKEILEDLIEDHEDFIISCGGGTPCFFNNIELMKNKGKVIWLNTDIDTLVKRLIAGKQSRPLLKNIPDSELKSVILKKIQERKLYYAQADVTLHEESLTLPHFMKIVQDV